MYEIDWFLHVFVSFVADGAWRFAEVGPAEMGKVRQGFETVLIADLGYACIRGYQVVLYIQAFLFGHPLVSWLSERIFE